MPRGGDARARAADAGAGGVAVATTSAAQDLLLQRRADAEAGLVAASQSATVVVSQLQSAHRNFEVALADGLELGNVSLAIRLELAASVSLARDAEAQLRYAQRAFAQMVYDEHGMAGTAAPRTAGEACAHGAALVRRARAEAAHLDSELWLSEGPAHWSETAGFVLPQGPDPDEDGISGFQRALAPQGPEGPAPASSEQRQGTAPGEAGFLGFTAAFSRAFDPQRPEGSPRRQAAPSAGGQLPVARAYHRCTWCKQPIMGADPLVCSWCDADFCPDCTWAVDDGSVPARYSCRCCNEGSARPRRR